MSKKGTSHWVEGLVLVSRGVRLHPRLTSTQSKSLIFWVSERLQASEHGRVSLFRGRHLPPETHRGDRRRFHPNFTTCRPTF